MYWHRTSTSIQPCPSLANCSLLVNTNTVPALLTMSTYFMFQSSISLLKLKSIYDFDLLSRAMTTLSSFVICPTSPDKLIGFFSHVSHCLLWTRPHSCTAACLYLLDTCHPHGHLASTLCLLHRFLFLVGLRAPPFREILSFLSCRVVCPCLCLPLPLPMSKWSLHRVRRRKSVSVADSFF